MNKGIIVLFVLLLSISVLPVISANDGNNSDIGFVKIDDAVMDDNDIIDAPFIGDKTERDVEYSTVVDDKYLDEDNFQEAIPFNNSKNYTYSDLNLGNDLAIKNSTDYNFSKIFTYYSNHKIYNNILNNYTSYKNIKYVLVNNTNYTYLN